MRNKLLVTGACLPASCFLSLQSSPFARKKAEVAANQKIGAKGGRQEDEEKKPNLGGWREAVIDNTGAR